MKLCTVKHVECHHCFMYEKYALLRLGSLDYRIELLLKKHLENN